MHIVVGTAGHIDHGKSTLVRALTGMDPDRLEEEKARGITIELGFAHTTIGEVRVAFVDVPGHERFVRTMLAGVGGIDTVMLVVAADESVMPQTREHFDICRLLKVRRGLVVMTKSDAADADTRELVRQEITELVAGSFLEGAPVLEVSATSGDGLDALRQSIAAQARQITQRPLDAPARLPIDRVFSMKGFGTVVTGTLVSGRIGLDADIVIEPGARPVKVRGVQVHGKAAGEVVAGQRAAINLGGVDVTDVLRGETLAPAGTFTVTRRVDADMELLPSARALRHGSRVRVHHGTAEVLARVSISGTAQAIEAGQQGLVRLRLESPAVLTRGDRVVLRAYSPPVTIGGGVVLDPAPTRPGIRSAEGRAALEALRMAVDDTPVLAAMIGAGGLAGLPVASVTSRAGVPPSDVPGALERLRSAGVVRVGDRLVDGRVLGQASTDLVALVAAAHTANAMSDGVPREEARERLFARVDPSIFTAVVEGLKSNGALTGSERLALPTHKPTVAGAGDDARTAILEAYRKAGLLPPDAAHVATSAGLPATMVDKVTQLLLREKTLVRLETLIFHAEALQGLKRDVTALKDTAPGGRATVDVATFKERYGLSRKYAIPLLEYLDRERVTRRTGDVRLVL